MAEEVLKRVLRGRSDGNHYAVLGVEPSLGDDNTIPAERRRAF